MTEKEMTPDMMFEMLARMKGTMKLYQHELNAHIELILAGEFDIADKLFDERHLLDRQMVAILQNKKEKSK